MADITIGIQRANGKTGGGAAVWFDVDRDGHSTGNEVTALEQAGGFTATVAVPDPVTGTEGCLFCGFDPFETVSVSLTGRSTPKSLVMDGQGRNMWLITL